MKNYLLYETETGRVRSKITCPETMVQENIDSRVGFSGIGSDDNPKKVWVDLSDTSIQSKVDNPATLSGKTLSNLPLPCTVTMRGPTKAEAYVQAGDLTLDADVPGRYTVTVVADHPKYYDAQFEVEL